MPDATRGGPPAYPLDLGARSESSSEAGKGTSTMRRTRRQFLSEIAAAGIVAGTLEPRAGFGGAPAEPGAPPATVAPSWPSQPPELAKEMVGVSHGDVARVRELLASHRTLANAAWDWGFGDWETALGAASHTGQREIAELLLEQGARPSIFSAAMLGQIEAVRAFVVAAPGSQATLGPHGLTLLHHARAGGERAAAVVAYLERLGDADPRLPVAPLAEEQEAAIVGRYRFGPDEPDVVEIGKGRSGLSFRRSGGSARPIFHRGELAFSPAGAPDVRIRFAPAAEGPMELTLTDGPWVVRARRI